MDQHGGIGIKRDDIQIYTSPDDGHPENILPKQVSYENTFLEEMKHFFDCLDNDSEPITNGREERKPLVAVLATYESFRTGERVFISDMETRDFDWKQYEP
jgi:predicted dehydrogenase